MNSSDLLKYITTAKLGDGTWKGTTRAFLLHWQDQIRLYSKLVPTDQAFSSDMKRVMLENAVHPIRDLRQVKTDVDQHAVYTGKHLTYEQYFTLLLSTATTYDAAYKPRSSASRRLVRYHELDDTDVYSAPSDFAASTDSAVDIAPSWDLTHGKDAGC